MPFLSTAGLWLSADLFNIVFGYLAFCLLALAGLGKRERRAIGWRLLSVHVYWMLIAVATLRAVRELIRAPHHWEKTPHGPQADPAEDPAPASATSGPPPSGALAAPAV